MALLGQASGGFTESSSALRILHVGIRNTVGILTDDSFTQTNPPIVTTSSTISTAAGVDTAVLGVLSGSVACTRPDVGSNYIGGNAENGVAGTDRNIRVLGCFINSAVGNAFENTPAVSSGKGPYVSAQGCYGNSVYETQVLDGTTTTLATGAALVYTIGDQLVASRNAYLMPNYDIANSDSFDENDLTLEAFHQNTADISTVIGILKMVADSTQPEIVYDQRI